MIPHTEYVVLSQTHALLLISIITGYEARNPNVSVFMKRPNNVAIITSTYPDRPDMKYYKIAFCDFDNNRVCFEMVTEGKERHILKCTGERKNFLKYFLNDTSEYNDKATHDLAPIFTKIEEMVKYPEKAMVEKPKLKLNMYNYNPISGNKPTVNDNV